MKFRLGDSVVIKCYNKIIGTIIEVCEKDEFYIVETTDGSFICLENQLETDDIKEIQDIEI